MAVIPRGPPSPARAAAAPPARLLALPNLGASWGNLANSPRAAAAAAPAPPPPPARRRTLAEREQNYIKRQYADLMEIIENPSEGDVVYDPEDPDNPEKVAMYHNGQWIMPVYNALGNYGGPYATERELLADERYREHQREFARMEANAARAVGRDPAVDIAEAVLAEQKGIPAEHVAAFRAAAIADVQQAMASGEGDPTKLAAKARRGMKKAAKAAGLNNWAPTEPAHHAERGRGRPAASAGPNMAALAAGVGLPPNAGPAARGRSRSRSRSANRNRTHRRNNGGRGGRGGRGGHTRGRGRGGR